LVAPCYAQDVSAADTDEARIQDIIAASHILTNEGILDNFATSVTRSAAHRRSSRLFFPEIERWKQIVQDANVKVEGDR
jgi:hypothetical protein